MPEYILLQFGILLGSRQADSDGASYQYVNLRRRRASVLLHDAVRGRYSEVFPVVFSGAEFVQKESPILI